MLRQVAPMLDSHALKLVACLSISMSRRIKSSIRGLYDGIDCLINVPHGRHHHRYFCLYFVSRTF